MLQKCLEVEPFPQHCKLQEMFTSEKFRIWPRTEDLQPSGDRWIWRVGEEDQLEGDEVKRSQKAERGLTV